MHPVDGSVSQNKGRGKLSTRNWKNRLLDPSLQVYLALPGEKQNRLPVWAPSALPTIARGLGDLDRLSKKGPYPSRCPVLPKVCPRTNSITWELVRNSDSQALPQNTLVRNLGQGGPAICVLTSPLGDSDTRGSYRSTYHFRSGEIEARQRK